MTRSPDKIRGFTILELLVVIAIISILAAVVIVALNASRGKGKDAGIKQQLSEVRNQAQLYFENMNGKYCDNAGYTVTGCQWGAFSGEAYCDLDLTVFDEDNSPSPHTVGAFIAAADINSPQNSLCFMDDFGTKWAVATKLNDTIDGWWCVDSSGNAKVVSGVNDDDVKTQIFQGGTAVFCP